ncbi:YitT family protein [Corallincola holothuriorum]|uniref:YitT family protein n=1 Tax=Corallincola holothuriorum TaxID=2282215 RepID=A0A368NQI7_9GAMM|nr:YitT family protein [Corallincola holothuriorum]RCU51531.1 YitT family protein [Corallincola holothuriorum]
MNTLQQAGFWQRFSNMAALKKFGHEWFARLEGCFLVSLGICFLSAAGLLVSGTAGLSIVTNELLPVTFGFWFFVINLPFFALAIKQLGMAFAWRSLICIVCVSATSDLMIYLIRFEEIPPLMSALIGGGLIGIGLILLFRHGTSLGGVNILALYMEKRTGIHAGKVILMMDLIVVAAGLMLFPLVQVAYSAFSFVVLSSVLGRYHKKAPISQQAEEQAQS